MQNARKRREKERGRGERGGKRAKKKQNRCFDSNRVHFGQRYIVLSPSYTCKNLRLVCYFCIRHEHALAGTRGHRIYSKHHPTMEFFNFPARTESAILAYCDLPRLFFLRLREFNHFLVPGIQSSRVNSARHFPPNDLTDSRTKFYQFGILLSFFKKIYKF